jgi:hypothetical protein
VSTHARPSSRRRTALGAAGLGLAAVAGTALWLGAQALAQPGGPPPEGPDGPGGPPPMGGPDGREDGPGGGPDGRRGTQEEMRRRIREFLQRQVDASRRRQERMEQALRMLDEGKTLEEIHAALPDLPHPGQRGEGRGEGRRGGPNGPGGPDGFDGPGPGGRDDRARVDDLGDATGLREPGGPGGPGGAGGRPEGGPRDGRHDGARGDGPRGDGPRGERDGPRDPARPLTPDEREAVRDFLRVAAPGILAKLEQLEKSDAPAAQRRWAEALPRVRPLLDLRTRDRALYDLRLEDIRRGRESMDAARAVAEAESNGSRGDAEAARTRLRDALRAQYRVRTQLLAHDLTKGKERMNGMQADLDARSSREDAVVDKNVRDLVEREARRLKNKGARPEGGRHADREDDAPPPPPPPPGGPADGRD